MQITIKFIGVIGVWTLLLCCGVQQVHSFGSLVNSAGLYNNSDNVITYSYNNFADHVYEKPYATLVEFYNSFCGYCRNFVPVYRDLATDVLRWHRILKIAAVDCSAEENLYFCGEYAVKIYPTMRYFTADHKFYNGTLEERMEHFSLGYNMTKSTVEVLRTNLVHNLTSEVNVPSDWPKLLPLELTDRTGLFDNLSEQVSYIFLLYGPETTNLTGNLIQLDLNGVPNIVVRHVETAEIAKALGLIQTADEEYAVAYVTRDLNLVPIHNLTSYDRDEVRQIIINELMDLDVNVPDWVVYNNVTDILKTHMESNLDDKDRQKLLGYLHRHPNQIYVSDIEASLRFALFNEIPRNGEIAGERLDALRQFVRVLRTYVNLDDRITDFLGSLHEYVEAVNGSVGGFYYSKFVRQAEMTNGTIFPRRKLLGCVGSTSAVRGYTCGLWQLFHHLTVEASLKRANTDGGEVVKAIHGYVLSFFGCTDCVEHFHNMTIDYNLMAVNDYDEAVLWLWRAHNFVNQRLSGEVTDDPQFPKVQYPSMSNCGTCQQQSSDGNTVFDENEVKQFLKETYRGDRLNAITPDELEIVIDHAIRP